MDASRVVRRPRAIGRGRVSKAEQDKENRGRQPVRRKVNNKPCNERKLATLHLRQSVQMCEDPHGHVLRKDGSKIPTFKARPRCRRSADKVGKSQTACVTADQELRNDLKVEVLNEAEIEVDVAKRVTKREKVVDIKPLPASPSEDKLPLKVPTNTPDNTPEVVRRPRAIGRGRVSKAEHDKENRGRQPVRRKVNNKPCNERKLATLHLRQSVQMCEDPHSHVLRKDGPKIPTFKARPRCRRSAVKVGKSQTTYVTADQRLRNDLKVEVLNEAEVEVLNEAEIEVDVARRVTKREKVVDIKPLPASPSEDKLPLKVPTNTPVDNTPEACKISEEVMIFLMQEVKVDDVLDVSMESDSSLMSPEGYQSDILSYLKEREGFIAMRGVPIQPNIETLHREILVDWLIDVQVHLDLANETLHLAIALMDAFLLNRSISLHYLQLLGITCLYVASKYEEVYFPNIETLCKLCANSYREGEFLIMERRILRTLDYDLFFPTAVDFLTRYLALADIKDERLVLICNYLVDLTLPCCHSKISCPSLWAATALFLALTVRKSETRHNLQDLFRVHDRDETVWDGRLQAVTGYSEFHLTELAQAMVEKVCVIKDSKYQATYQKYNTRRLQNISEELAKWCCTTNSHLVSHNLMHIS